MDKGIIQIYYGEGQGKTSAALGNAIRKASNGQSAYVVQFMKGQLDTEYLTRLEPEVKVFRFERCSEGFDALDEAEKQEQKQNIQNGLNFAKKALVTGQCDMLVLDDGWFGKRDDDNSGLGDWYVNEKKLGETLGGLVKRVNDLGVKFGIWIEPEMISEDSDLYREHPDCALTIPGRKPVRSRNQLVLDFSRKEVVDGIFGQISAVLDNANIEYVKWDMNRSLMDVFSVMTKDQGRVMYDYVLGLYDFLDRMVKRYPDLLIEGCSGGGGRFDAGMLYYTPQIWCSDNSDAVDRLRIQYGTSFGYPVSAMGAHVSAVPNHQTGRITPLHTRGVVAMSGTFGYELDLLKLTEEEKDEVRSEIGEFRK